MRRQVVTDISNCLIYSTVANQLAHIRRKYVLSKAGAAAVGRCLGTSTNKRLALAVTAHIKSAEAGVHVVRRDFLVALKRVPQDLDDVALKRGRYEARRLRIEREKMRVELNQQLALGALTITPLEEEKHAT